MSPALKKTATAMVALLILAGLAWGLLKAFEPQRLPLQAQMEAQEINVSSKLPGRVGRLAVALGQQVQAGELLFELDSPELQAKLVQARSAREAAQAVANKASNGARPEEILMARHAWERAETGAQLAGTTYRRVQAMFEEGLIARQKRDEAEAQWRAAQQQALAARAQYQLAQNGTRAEDREAAQAQARQVGGVLSETEVALAETRIVAPIGGEVGKIQTQAGELAPQGFPVITLVNLADSWAVLQLREDELAGFAMGSEHRGEVPALKTGLQFKVSAISVMPDFATWRAARPGGADLRTFELRLRPVKPPAGLRPGMSVVFARGP